MAQKMRVVYSDGREEIVSIRPVTLVATEKNFKGVTESNALQATYFMAWHALHKLGKEPNDFAGFLELLDDAENLEDGEPADPTRTEPPSDGSSP